MHAPGDVGLPPRRRPWYALISTQADAAGRPAVVELLDTAWRRG